MVMIERILARIVEFIACDLFMFDSDPGPRHIPAASGDPPLRAVT